MDRLVVGILLVAVAAVGFAARDALGELLLRDGAPAAQRPLAGGTAGESPPAAGPVRVILVDGLGRADAARMPGLDALCAGGLDLVVDVGFPTKSLPVQLVLWSGLTQQQLGARGDNLETAPPPSSVPALVAGSVAVVESHAQIARSAGFARILPAPDADRVDPVAAPGAVRAWREGGFVAAAVAEVAGAAPLVLVHVLAIDAAAHREGKGGATHQRALAGADRFIAGLVEAAPAAQWLVLSDHGHVAGGGHGDAEDEVRRVRACWHPALPGVTAAAGAEVHLVDVSRWLADVLGVPRHARATGRPLAVAVAHPDRDATLPRPTTLARGLALLVLALGTGLALAAARSRATALWPLVAALVIAVAHGVPTLSDRAPPLLLLVTGACLAGGAAVIERRVSAPSPVRVAITSLGCIASLVIALGVVTGLPGALAGGVPPRVPGWTGLLAAAAQVLAGAIAGTGSYLALEALLGHFRGSRPARRG